MFCSFFSQCLGASAVKQNHGDTEAQRGLRPHPKFQISNSRSVGENDSSDGKSLRAAKKFTNNIRAMASRLSPTSLNPDSEVENKGVIEI